MIRENSEVATLLKIFFRSNDRSCSAKIDAVKVSQENTKLQLYQKDTAAQVFS